MSVNIDKNLTFVYNNKRYFETRKKSSREKTSITLFFFFGRHEKII